MDGELARTTFRPLRPHRIYRLRLERDGDRVRLITRGGYNWTDRYLWIVSAQTEGGGNARSSRQISTSKGPLLVKADIEQLCRKCLLMTDSVE